MKKKLTVSEGLKELELYLHIPFCVRKCNYCDFLSMPADETVRRHYVNMLMEEIREKGKYCREYRISTIFFGGGTPSLLPGVQIAELMEILRGNFALDSDAEITMECNPGTLDGQKLLFYKNSGVNRLSMGLQSADSRELKLLGRIHSFEQFLENFELARKTGIKNINVDLISGLPGQMIKDWEYTLESVLALKPEHISAYSLIVEEGTPFFEKYGEDEFRRERGEQPRYLPEEETEREMYQRTKNMLEEKGYHRYEISNYARPGRECRHNIGYWRGVPYLGLGLGSSSFMDGMRFSNPRNLEEYLKGNYRNLACILENKQKMPENRIACICEETSKISEEPVWVLNKKQQMEEFMFLGLRMMEGISQKEFRDRFEVELEEVYGEELHKFQKQGLLAQKEGSFYLTEEGIAVSNYVLSEFLLP